MNPAELGGAVRDTHRESLRISEFDKYIYHELGTDWAHR